MSREPDHIGPLGMLAQLTGFAGHVILICGRANVDLVSGFGGDRVIVGLISWDNHHHRANVQLGGQLLSSVVLTGIGPVFMFDDFLVK